VKRTPLVIGALAAAVVVSSTSGAVAGAMITGKQVKDESLTGKDVRDASLSQADIAPAAQQSFIGGAAYVLVGRDGSVTRGFPIGAATVSSPFPGTWCVRFDGLDAAQYAALAQTNFVDNDSVAGTPGRVSYVEVDATAPACTPGEVQVLTGTVSASGGSLQVTPGNWGFFLALV
jgi:hypothetical protein